ncbi:tastin isoform X2 [Tenrec ecaudatus]|uniref:tastin isoform X2 n=1 Tax=Tenrec ecaudatus TaxID=94439 RepID=UPI003F5A7EC6
MTTVQASKDLPLRGVSPTPSKIPVRSQRCTPLPGGKPCSLVDQENQDPKRLMQKASLSLQHPVAGRAGPKPKSTSQTEKSERWVESTQLRNPLEELKISPKGRNVGPGPPPHKEAPRAIEFVADPAALATILSGEGVKSCHLGRQPSLAQRVLVRGSQQSALQRGQSARASAYLAPRTPSHRMDPARASCFSRLEGPGPRGKTLCPQKLETLVPPSGPSYHSSTRPSFLELRRMTGGSNRTSVHRAPALPLESPAQPASFLPEGEYEIVTHSDEGRGSSLGLAQRVPLRGMRGSHDAHLLPSPGQVAPPADARPSPFGQAQRVQSPHPSALTSYSVLRRLALRPKTQFTPIPSAPRVQQGRWLRGPSPQTCAEPEEPVLPWEQIAVQLFDQESSTGVQEEPAKEPVGPNGLPPNRTPDLQELKMQRISILHQLLQRELEGLLGNKCAPLQGACSLDLAELHPPLTDVARKLNVPQLNSGTSHLPGPILHSESPKACLPEEGAGPQPCPPAEPGVPDSCHRRESEIPELSPQQQPRIPEPSHPKQHGVPELSAQQQTGVPEPFPQEQPGVPEPSPSKQHGVSNPCPPKQFGKSKPSPQQQPGVAEPSPQQQPGVPEPSPSKQHGVSNPFPPEQLGKSKPSPQQQPGIAEPSLQQQPGVPDPSPSKHHGVPNPCPPKKLGKSKPSPQQQPGVSDPSPSEQHGVSDPCPPKQLGGPKPSPQQQPGVPEPCPLAEPELLQPSLQGKPPVPEPHLKVEPATPEANPVRPCSVQSLQQPCSKRCASDHSLISQHPPCANPPIHSIQCLRPGKELVGRGWGQGGSHPTLGAWLSSLPQMTLLTSPPPPPRLLSCFCLLSREREPLYLLLCAPNWLGPWERVGGEAIHVYGGSIGL